MTTPAAYLIDSPALLWWWFDPDRLSPPVQRVLTDAETRVHVSAATVWELSLKHHQGKCPELGPAINALADLLRADGFQPLPIALARSLRAGSYNQPHRDPFDRMLAAQAELEAPVLLSADPQFSTFPCEVLW